MLQEPAVRLATLEAAGQELVPFTTGILIGELLPELCGACSIEARMSAPAQQLRTAGWCSLTASARC